MAVEQALQATKLLAHMLRDPTDREVFLAHGWEPGQPLLMADETELTGTVVDRSLLYFDQEHTQVTVCVFNNDNGCCGSFTWSSHRTARSWRRCSVS